VAESDVGDEFAKVAAIIIIIIIIIIKTEIYILPLTGNPEQQSSTN